MAFDDQEYDELPPATFSISSRNDKLSNDWSAQVELSFEAEGRGKNMVDAQANCRKSLSDFVGRLASETVENFG